jgi:hypothetical protein
MAYRRCVIALIGRRLMRWLAGLVGDDGVEEWFAGWAFGLEDSVASLRSARLPDRRSWGRCCNPLPASPPAEHRQRNLAVQVWDVAIHDPPAMAPGGDAAICR